MDTNINNYSYNDIIAVLKLTDHPIINIETLYHTCKSIIIQINTSKELIENPDNIIEFFKNCFIRACVVNGFIIQEAFREGLSLDPLPIQPIITSPTDIQVIEAPPYIVDGLPSAIASTPGNAQYYRGGVNILDVETITNILVVNSKFRPEYDRNQYTNQSDHIKQLVTNKIQSCDDFRTSAAFVGSVADYSIELDEPYTEVVSMKLSNIQLLNGYYPISAYLGTSQFTIESFIYDAASSTGRDIQHHRTNTHIITIPDGSYSIPDLIYTLNQIFIDLPIPIRVEYHKITGKMSFILNKEARPLENIRDSLYKYGFNLNFAINSDPYRRLDLNIGWMLGYRKIYYSFFEDYHQEKTNLFSIGINGEAAMNLIGTPYFLLEIEDYNNNNPTVINYNSPTAPYSFNINNLIAQVPNSGKSNTILFEDSLSTIFKERKYFGPVKIRKIRVRLLDDVGRAVNLHGSEFSISLEITCLNKPYNKNIT